MPFAPSKYIQILLKVQVQLKHTLMNRAQNKQQNGALWWRGGGDLWKERKNTVVNHIKSQSREHSSYDRKDKTI